MFTSNYTGTQIDEAVGKVIEGKVGGMTSTTYKELVELRNQKKLIPGMQYRITDYMTTTSQENTKTAGHQFDIIVTADSKNVLNEKARAIQHDFSESEEEDYFANSNLAAWELWYSLDNDTERFAWADENQTTQFKLTNDDQLKTGMLEGLSTEIVDSVSNGIITTSNFLKIQSDLDKLLYVKDDNVGSKIYTEGGHLEVYINKCENTNEHEGFVNGSYTYIYKLTTGYGTNNKVEYLVHTKTKYKLITKTDWYDGKSGHPANEWYNLELNGSPTSYFVPTDFLNIINKTSGINVLSYTSPSVCGEITNVTPNGKGVIYRMIDEFENDCPYDFKNIMFLRKIYDDFVWYYTFTNFYQDLQEAYFSISDCSVYPIRGYEGTSYCCNNIIKCCTQTNYYIDEGSRYDKIYYDYSRYLNDIVMICESNKIANYSNTFDFNCHNITLNSNCYLNTFDFNCHNITLDSNCYLNTFGNDCCNIVISGGGSNNTFLHSSELTLKSSYSKFYFNSVSRF